MGTTVLDAGVPIKPAFMSMPIANEARRAACVVLVINTDRDAPHALVLPVASLRYTLDAAHLLDADVRLNGRTLALDAGDELPAIAGVPTAADIVTFQPVTITFLAIPDAGNNACR